MGRIGRLIQTAIEKFIVQTVETYAGVNLSADTYAPPGTIRRRFLKTASSWCRWTAQETSWRWEC